MAKRLTKRTTTTEAPKPLPSRNSKEEPDVICQGATTAVTEKDSAPMLGKCVKCNNQANSEADHLCYNCHKTAAGFVYDEDQNRYIKKSKGRK